ncbi:MAG: hypothetical protein QW767_04965 [Thermoprotei archaeon]
MTDTPAARIRLLLELIEEIEEIDSKMKTLFESDVKNYQIARDHLLELRRMILLKIAEVAQNYEYEYGDFPDRLE